LKLQDVAKRQKSVSTRYWGLEGFFVVGANPKQVMLEACSSMCADSSSVDSSIPFPGNGVRIKSSNNIRYNIQYAVAVRQPSLTVTWT